MSMRDIHSTKGEKMIRNILDYLENSAERFPDKTAFADEHTSCFYRELEIKARMAGACIAEKAEAGSPIPVFMEKSVNAIYAFMGAVYAGCFYILLDPKFPSERLKQILNTLEARVLVADMTFKKQLDELEFEGEILDIDTVENKMTKEEIYVFTVDVNELRFDICMPVKSVFGEPAIGRRIKADIWLQGKINF